MKTFLSSVVAFCLLCNAIAQAQFDVKQIKAQVIVTRVTEDTSQLQSGDVPFGPAVVTRSEPKTFPAAAAVCVKVFPLEGKQFGENLISRVFVDNKTATAQLIETTPEYVIYAFTQAGTHVASFKQIGQNPLDFAEKDVTVVVGPAVDPKPPVDPVPPISGAVADASRKGAQSLNDPVTAAAMANALRSAIESASSRPLAEQKTIVRSAIETVLLNRQGASRTKDWLALWREPVNNAIAGENPNANYLGLIQQAIDGLTTNPSVSRTMLPLVTVFTTSNCQLCDRFKINDVPLIDFATVSFDDTQSNRSISEYPAYQIQRNQKVVLVQGYRSASQLRQLIGQL